MFALFSECCVLQQFAINWSRPSGNERLTLYHNDPTLASLITFYCTNRTVSYSIIVLLYVNWWILFREFWEVSAVKWSYNTSLTLWWFLLTNTMSVYGESSLWTLKSKTLKIKVFFFICLSLTGQLVLISTNIKNHPVKSRKRINSYFCK